MASSDPEGDSSTSSEVMSRTSSMWESLRSYSLSSLTGVRVDKEELRFRLLISPYIRLAMQDATKKKDVNGGDWHSQFNSENAIAPEYPMVVFINSRSGGRQGPDLKQSLLELLSEEQIFDLKDVSPNDFVRYGLGYLEKQAKDGDLCAKSIRENIRIVVAGGDGTVGWMLGSLRELHQTGREPVPPVAIIPLGTGNDLARSFGWIQATLSFTWKSLSKRILHRAANGPIARLDSWCVLLEMPRSKDVDVPHSMKAVKESNTDPTEEFEEEESPKRVKYFEGVFYNYFSIGMDAQVAYGFHSLRNQRPDLAQGPISNKIIYSGYSCSQGWFLTSCSTDPALRGLKNILRIHIIKVDSSQWEQIPVPNSVRAIVVLNLHNYASGRNPWGTLRQAYLEKKGFVQAHADDGILEIFGLKQGWHASLVMADLISAKHIAQDPWRPEVIFPTHVSDTSVEYIYGNEATAVRMEMRGGDCKETFMQMDGEPWKQPLSKKKSTLVQITRMPFQSVMISGE